MFCADSRRVEPIVWDQLTHLRNLLR
uniref:Uncharacterized protein n=1 Tax=Arundo donax TaxID=35708 RepID=A0A0A8ZHF1_ARUDO